MMKKESIEELRLRLTKVEAVQEMIRIRAYEIYESRGGRPGHPHYDWLQAENETLMRLIEEESRPSKGKKSSKASVDGATPDKVKKVRQSKPAARKAPKKDDADKSARKAPKLRKGADKTA
jgi:hypothetical protein